MHTYHKLFLAVIFVFYGWQGMAQDVPYMYVPRKTSSKREKRFKVGVYGHNSTPGKQALLTKIIGTSHPTNYAYPISSFSALIDTINANNSSNAVTGIRVYIVAYDRTASPRGVNMGGIADKQLVLLFAASKGCQDADVGNYYIIDPVDYKVRPVGSAVKKAWENHYVIFDDRPANSTGLVGTLQPGQSENQENDGNYSDTRSIFYCLPDFVDYFVNEPRYQATQNVTINQIRATFAAYTDAGDPSNKSQFKDRLIVMYEFGGPNGLVDIEKTPGFKKRNRKKIPFCSCSETKGGDNGQLCPPNCPCPTCL